MLKFTVVTPVLNGRRFIRDAIESVLSQRSVNLEYIVMDGGSTDGTVDIIREYEAELSYWQTGRDGGQAKAISDGFKRGSGEILCWLNADDYYAPRTFQKVAEQFEATAKPQLIYGDYVVEYADGRCAAKPKISFDFEICLMFYLMIPQPSSFWTREIYEAVGGLDVSLRCAFDYDFFLRVGHRLRPAPASIVHVPDLWSTFRVHPDSKSVAEKHSFQAEAEKVRERFGAPARGIKRQFRNRVAMLRTLGKFAVERGFVPIRKDKEKA